MDCKPYKGHRIWFLVKIPFLFFIDWFVNSNALGYRKKNPVLLFYGEFESNLNNHEAVMHIPLLERSIPVEKTMARDVENNRLNLGFY